MKTIAQVILLLVVIAQFDVRAAENDAAKPDPARPADSSKIKETRKLMANDVLAIRVIDEPSLTQESRVKEDGTITYPFLGSLDVKGKTPAEVETIIHDGLAKDYLVNPQVLVDVKAYTSLKVNVTGQVNREGPVELPPERQIDVLEAIGLAGGFTRVAKKSNIEVRRDGKVHKFKFDELKDADPAKKFYLQPDDVIFVSERAF